MRLLHNIKVKHLYWAVMAFFLGWGFLNNFHPKAYRCHDAGGTDYDIFSGCLKKTITKVNVEDGPIVRLNIYQGRKK